MGAMRRRKPKPKINPRPKIDYPPVPTRKWIPPDKRPKPRKPEPKYAKPEGITQKLAISSLHKVWHNFIIYKGYCLLTGHFSQTHKRFSFKTNGYQGACNCAVACIYAHLHPMATFTSRHLDEILLIGDMLYQKSVNQGDRCLVEVSPLQVFNNFFLGPHKINMAIEIDTKTIGRLYSVTEQKAKNVFLEVLQEFFRKVPSGIFSMLGKYLAIWIQDGAYYLFDPTEHDMYGNRWSAMPSNGAKITYGCGCGSGGGVAVLFRCKDLTSLVNQLYNNVDAKTANVTFEIIGCIIQRIVPVNTMPPPTFEDVAPVAEELPEIVEEETQPCPKVLYSEALIETLMEPSEDTEETQRAIQIQEISPDFSDDFPPSRRPSWMGEEHIDKADLCLFPIPAKPHVEALSYYLDVLPNKMSILRAATCQTDPKFSKYEGRQSMGNAMSALIMLRFSKSAVWVPRILNTVLKYGDLLYRDAMVSIPRTQTLKLSNFPKKVEYEGKLFAPIIQENVAIGRLNSQDYDVLDLLPALEDFLTDHDSCIIRGPLTLAIWLENNNYYMFDPNERDDKGELIIKSKYVGANLVNLDYTPGFACVTKFATLKNLVELYIYNVEKIKRNEPFYLNYVQINDYEEIPENWYSFTGIAPGKWIIRASFSQASDKFSPETRNSQGPANALLALMMQNLTPVKDWASDTLDQILIYGDELYTKTVENENEKGQFVDKHLLLSEVNKSFNFENKQACFDVEDCIFNGIINAKSENDLPGLKKGLEHFFADNDTGVLTTRNISLAVWKKEEMYYYFDPYPRDDKGVASIFGTACTVKTIDLDEFVKSVEANLDPDIEDFFNINKVVVRIYEAGEEGILRPPLKFYTKIDNNRAILRSIFSEISNKFCVTNVGKQTVPMCITAVAYNRLKPSIQWDKNDMDDILSKGDELYVKTMEEIYKNQEEVFAPSPDQTGEDKEGANHPADVGGEQDEIEEGPGEEEKKSSKYDLVSSRQVKRIFNVGPNNIRLEFEDFQEGAVKEELQDALRSFFEQEQTDDYFNQELLLECDLYTVVLWRDDKVFFLFDSKPRDKFGNVIGQEDWLPEPPPPKIKQSKKKKKGKARFIDDQGAGGDQPEETLNVTNFDDYIAGESKAEGEEEGRSEEEGIKYPPFVPKGSSFWREKQKEGKACVLWFTKLDDLVKHIFDNIPPLKRADAIFKLRPIKLINEVQLKSKYDPEDERNDVYAGDYYDFSEIESGRWILRGTTTLYDQMFPEDNRGKQLIPTCVTALAIAFAFGMTCFNYDSVNTILTYGDRLHTFLKRSRKKQILSDKNLSLKEDEVDWLLKEEEFSAEDMAKKVCISKFSISIDMRPEEVVGDIKAQDVEDIYDVKRGLKKFFEDFKYGILSAKTLSVAIWRGERIYYMFDGLSRGPSGIQTANGTACVTRYLDVEKMAEVFLQNLPTSGKNIFYIHGVILGMGVCPRERVPKTVFDEPKKIVKTGGFHKIMPGKCIIRGTINQNDPKFNKEPNSMSAPIAVIALTMSLIHKPNIWSRPIVDDIIVLGSELYDDSLRKLGFEFNPWEETLDIWRVNNDYKIGVVKANCELRNMDQRGVIDIKDPQVLNLRQGIEHFFEENTHGVLVTEPLTLALWEEEQDNNETLIYMFDPYPRGPSGMPVFDGTGCVVTFVNAKMTADHIISCILDPDQKLGDFVIVPVEIVVGKVRTRQKVKKSPSRSEVGVLPRCSKLVASETKKKLRKLAEEQRKIKEAKRVQMIGRTGYHVMKGGEAIIRGFRSQNSEVYSEQSRGNQDIPNCILAIVGNMFLTIDHWSHEHVDLMLDIGNQLYIDSYIVYGPKDKKLGMENVLRKFVASFFEIHVTIYKPIISDLFNAANLNRIFNSYFQEETFCLLSYCDQWVAIFFKAGYFYVFDPHERDIEGNKMRKGSKEVGCANVTRFENISAMCLKLLSNLIEDFQKSVKEFTLWLLEVDISYDM